MIRDDIIRMAREAGAIPIHKDYKQKVLVGNENIERFAELVRAQEREAWKKEREQLMTQIGVLRSQLLGVRMQFGEGSTVSNLSAALQAEDAVNTASILARGQA